MKIQKITDDKINNIINLLQELSWLKDLDDVKDLSNGDFPILESLVIPNTLHKVIEQDPLEFLRGLGYYVKQLHFIMLGVNLKALLKNCADPNNDVLEFKPELTSALEVNNKIVALKEKRQAENERKENYGTPYPIYDEYGFSIKKSPREYILNHIASLKSRKDRISYKRTYTLTEADALTPDNPVCQEALLLNLMEEKIISTLTKQN